jgi:hypothetical protein
MAKRSRRPKQGEDVQPADHTLMTKSVVAEKELDVASPGYAEFDAHIDCELESLVARWLHIAAPGAANFRRVARRAKQEAGDQV